MSGASRKGWKGIGMEGFIARWYTRTRQKDLREFRNQAELVAQQLSHGSRVLEVAPGPGFFAIELRKLGTFDITGLDVSHSFVRIAHKNAQEAGVNVDFRFGNASSMPFGDESFDFVYCSAAFKNFSQPLEALNEIHRVLRMGGRAMIVDLCKDTPMAEIEAYVKQSGRNPFDAWMTKMAFQHLLLKRAYPKAEFTRLAQRSRFGGCRVESDAIGLNVHLRKSAA